ELPDDRLDEAERSEGRVGVAELYQEIIHYWLDGEVRRESFPYGRKVLPKAERLAACRALALRLWTAPDADGDAVSVEELARATSEVLTGLEALGFSGDQATQTVGSGSLLTRSSHGFGFVHRSVMEWLVADTAATELKEGNEPATLAAREMSDLMTDFFCDLAGHVAALDWASRTRHPAAGTRSAASAAAQANATRIRARLHRRGDTVAIVGATAGGDRTRPAAPLDLSGQDLRDQDLAAFALAGGRGPGLRGAVLRDANVAGRRLTGLDLTGADLTAADLTRSRLEQVGLAGAHLVGTRVGGARLAGVNLAGAGHPAAGP